MLSNPMDQQARDMARSALSAIDAHEKVCAERWAEARAAVADIKRILAWGATGLIGSMGGVILLLLRERGL